MPPEQLGGGLPDARRPPGIRCRDGLSLPPRWGRFFSSLFFESLYARARAGSDLTNLSWNTDCKPAPSA
jgi:hypothetical protein